jgi:serine/threonine-protein kinase
MGLVVNQAEDIFSDKYAPGTVAHIEPVGQGGQVPKGATITINVSKGPDVVNVPDVYGLTLQDAVAALQAGGCAQGTITGPIDKRVIKLSPDKGVVVKRGTPINITLG